MFDARRPDRRLPDEMRLVTMEPGIAPHAGGSVLIRTGNTVVICAACLEQKVPGWMQREKKEGGWLTAEYSMLPYSTLDRRNRDVTQGKLDGRSIEIQRLIGRALRAVIDLTKLPGHTLWIDCDVLQADGGTRAASITGAYVAARMAVDKFLREKRLASDPFKDTVAAVSVGIYSKTPVLDMCYAEDLTASVDSTVVMTGSGRFVEVHTSAEEAVFEESELHDLLSLAKKGINELTARQKIALGEAKSKGM
jgi:ribonuclease PH